MSSGFVVIVVLVVIAMIAIGVFSYLAQKRRLEGFALVASEQGLSFAEDDPFETLEEPFALFDKGDGNGVENVMWIWRDGSARLRLLVLPGVEEHCRGTPRGPTTGSTVCGWRWRPTALTPRSTRDLLARLADALSFHDIEFESEAFNRAFTVKSADEKFANDLIDARMMTWLLANATDSWIELVSDQILLARRRLEPAELPRAHGARHRVRGSGAARGG